MYRTLEDLKDSVDRLIADLGKDAPCAAFVFTPYDVYEVDDNGDFIQKPLEVAEQVLENVGECDYLYETIGRLIDEELRGA
jgi:hypothetical protein